MTRTGFVLANLGRRKTRTVLTMLSIVTAFLLYFCVMSGYFAVRPVVRRTQGMCFTYTVAF